ncbi:MAG TPA: hypothetical protein VE954_43155 [Oligoflexus sp.]|nr:hypothetical protein [Oligoflexus sp.]HYX39943.1 hypothetical protein [Oligoflexus sp.]
MKPENRWPLYFRDHERFCRNPLKDEIKMRFAVSGLFFIITVNVINWLWS